MPSRLSFISLAVAVLLTAAISRPLAGEDTARATFAGGCFWCMEPPFEELDGVISVVSGYIGGTVENPTYEQVAAGGTGHAEAVEIKFDPARISYWKLLDVFWRNIDPLTADAQFCDQGSQYRSAIFYHDDTQRMEAAASAQRVTERLGERIVTEINAAGQFYRAEDDHQDYYKKKPKRYKFYRWGCGRDQRLEEVWGSASG
jgi:peptide-methionine (S)-S-oxide reductase